MVPERCLGVARNGAECRLRDEAARNGAHRRFTFLKSCLGINLFEKTV